MVRNEDVEALVEAARDVVEYAGADARGFREVRSDYLRALERALAGVEATRAAERG